MFFQSNDGAVPYVVELADDGVFFPNAVGHRPQSNDEGDRETFESFVRVNCWVKFENGNPFRNGNYEVKFHLQQWNEGGQEVIAGVKSKPHWAAAFIYTTEEGAREHKTEFEADGSKWRIVKKTEEVLP